MPGTTVAEVPVEAQHVAVAIKDIVPSTNAEIKKLQEIRDKRGGADMFKAAVELPADTVKEPNFDELVKVKDMINVAATKTAVGDRIKILKEIVEKQNLLSPDQRKLIGGIASEIPQIVLAIAKETGLDPADAKVKLKLADPTVNNIILRLKSDDWFVRKLSANLGTIEETIELTQLNSQIEASSSKTDREKKDIDATKKIYTNPPPNPPGAKEWFEGQPPAAQTAIVNDVTTYESAIATLNVSALGPLQKAGLTHGEVPSYQGQVDAEIIANCGLHYAAAAVGGGAAADAAIDAMGGIGGVEKARRKNVVRTYLGAYSAATRIGLLGGGFPDTLRKYQQYQEYPAKLSELKRREDQLDQDLAQLKADKTKRDKMLHEFASKIMKITDKSFREYYNTILLADAQRVAQYDAEQKTEEETKAKDLKTKQETNAKVILDKYLRLSYLKYKAGKVTGWDDKGLKDLVKKDLFAHSPAEMSRKLLKRIWDNKLSMPPTYKAEIEALAKEMGVGSGPPPVTFNDVLKVIDTDKLASYAAEEMPKAFGYARARGYYFDRLSINRPQAEFVKTAYANPEFFVNVLEKEKGFKEEFEKEFKLGKGVLNGPEAIRFYLRKYLTGDNWVEGFQRTVKAASVAGAAVLLTQYLGGAATLGEIGNAGYEILAAGNRVLPRTIQDTAAKIANAAANIS